MQDRDAKRRGALAPRVRRRISIGVERVLYLAATDPTFRNVLECDRQEALRQWEIELTPSEARMLESVPNTTLNTMIAAVQPQSGPRRRFMTAVAAASAAAVGVVEISCTLPTSTGVRPDDSDAGPDAEVVDDDADVLEDAEISEDATP